MATVVKPITKKISLLNCVLALDRDWAQDIIAATHNRPHATLIFENNLTTVYTSELSLNLIVMGQPDAYSFVFHIISGVCFLTFLNSSRKSTVAT